MSSINAIQSTYYNSYVNTTAEAASKSSKPAAASEESTASSAASAAESAGVVYEKPEDKVISDTKDGKVTEKTSTDRSAIIKQMQDDLNARKQQMLDIVRKTMTGQGNTFGIANSDDDGIWSVFAKGNFTVTEAAKAQAQKDISEDGYWGVNQTSDRIVKFAKTLAGDDSSKAEELLNAFKKGYKQATGTWGQNLPDISSQTYDAVVDKFNTWMNEKEEDAA